MRLLLDTHIAVWAISDDPRLTRRARALIEDQENAIWVSAVSVWEIAIKHAVSPRDMTLSGRQALECFQGAGYDLLPITPSHAAALDGLKPHHADPFDRLLVTQAVEESLRLITADRVVAGW